MYNKEMNFYKNVKSKKIALVATLLALLTPPSIAATGQMNVNMTKETKSTSEFNGGIFLYSKNLQKISSKMHQKFPDHKPNNSTTAFYPKKTTPKTQKVSFSEMASRY